MRLLSGLAQALAVWVAAIATVWLVRNVAVLWAALVTALAAVILLGHWHRRRSRPDTAVGAYTGAVLWPVLFGAALIAINIVAGSSSYE
ncbi:hypothetical protein Aab01nite_16810 [Paractinoplanes abujensis]|uniref:Heme O synthase-like polyprenyltransferase n=1 Tax=Paractinoplanes abujensis TaxID=882441 RepID=A0A7W7G6B8_9ACTN|nr:hypothetical protein [Actinoplanes abujensis]MBB4697434.1 heme O synthase-like polyprenyltransferase [Actinoplanes abujensis]GID18091.1 hypothetical protein Aab01nite_16810 [Actinoplanes abujensis]